MERLWELRPNIIIVDSFTKSYGIPGIRLGYVIASAEIIDQLAAIRPPWSVNSLSLKAGEYILERHNELQPNIMELVTESRYLQDKIAKISGFRVTPSDCNFFLVEICNSTSQVSELKKFLIDKHGILIRDASNFVGLTNSHFRIAAQERKDVVKLINALKEWISTQHY